MAAVSALGLLAQQLAAGSGASPPAAGPLLLERATRVCGVGAWWRETVAYGLQDQGDLVNVWAREWATFYRWLSGTRVLFAAGPWTGWTFRERDVATGAESPLDGLTRAADSLRGGRERGSIGGKPTGLADVSISPDGRVAALVVFRYVRTPHRVHQASATGFAATDGSRWCTEAEAARQPWLAGERAWVRRVESRWALTPGRPRWWRFGQLLDAVGVSSDRSFRCVAVAYRDWPPAPGGPPPVIVEGSLDHPRAIRRTVVHLPAGAILGTWGAATFSPAGDRIAWVLGFQRPHGVLEVGLWVSRADGTRMREVGHIAGAPSDVVAPVNVAWLPDGRRLSFVHQNALWTVSAE